MTAAARHAVVGGHRLEYRWVPGDGTPGRPVLVFLHQGLGSISMWRDTPAHLAARTGCPALVYSRCGHGRSEAVAAPRAPGFMIDEGAAVLPELLRVLGVDDVVLVGHSDGATIALAYLAAGHAARAAIVVAPHVFDEDVTWRSIAGQRASWGADGVRDRLRRHHDDVDGMFFAWADVWLSPAMRGWDMRPALGAIACPILALQGAADTHGTIAHIDGVAASSGGPVECALLERCGHDPFREQPEAALTRCADFIARFRDPAAPGPRAEWVAVDPTTAVDPSRPIAATAGMVRLVLWQPEGMPVAVWEDSCPHRGGRLSAGRISDGNLVCAKHGWRFEADGRRVPPLEAAAVGAAGWPCARVCRTWSDGTRIWAALAATPVAARGPATRAR